MILDTLIISLAVAGTAVLWRNLLHDVRWLRESVNRLWYPFKRALACGFCFTYWLALFAVLAANPLQSWEIPTQFILSNELSWILHILIGWMVVGIVAAIIRFSYAALQETVHWQVHTLNSHGKHHKH